MNNSTNPKVWSLCLDWMKHYVDLQERTQYPPTIREIVAARGVQLLKLIGTEAWDISRARACFADNVFHDNCMDTLKNSLLELNPNKLEVHTENNLTATIRSIEDKKPVLFYSLSPVAGNQIQEISIV